jgi:hypothetical protein
LVSALGTMFDLFTADLMGNSPDCIFKAQPLCLRSQLDRSLTANNAGLVSSLSRELVE